ncbi:hypothetical protein KC320_g45 [Hortaea werneckii]|nr:hypothetical protein KC320_g45 [Hortaea werneckii]
MKHCCCALELKEGGRPIAKRLAGAVRSGARKRAANTSSKAPQLSLVGACILSPASPMTRDLYMHAYLSTLSANPTNIGAVVK